MLVDELSGPRQSSDYSRAADLGRWPSVTIVIPTRGRPALLRRCLRALARQTYPCNRYDVVVVEDGGPGSAKAVVEKVLASQPWLTIHYSYVNSTGPAAARNAGWRLASGEIIGFTDDDAVPHPGWVEQAIRAFSGGADAVSGRTIVPISRRPTDYERNTKKLETAPFVTCNAFCRRDLLERIGGFDTRFTRAWREDSDLQFALLQAGATIVRAEDAIVYHPVRPGTPLISLRQQSNQFFDALLYRKHPAHFRTYIRRHPPGGYYAITAGQLVSLASLVLSQPHLAALATAVWAPLVALFCLRRLRGNRLTPAHVAEMIVTSLLIPPVAVYWRLRGAWAFRVAFF